jgi:hypothetical protein
LIRNNRSLYYIYSQEKVEDFNAFEKYMLPVFIIIVHVAVRITHMLQFVYYYYILYFILVYVLVIIYINMNCVELRIFFSEL